jgi:RNA polymerase sigma-70 factor (ECF subfamily)
MADELSDLKQLYRLDPQAIASVYDRFYPDVYRYIRYRIGDETLAEDFASEVFVRLMESLWARRGPDTNLRGWLIGTANHIVSDHFRLLYHSPVDELPEEMEGDETLLPAEAEMDVEQEVEQQEKKQDFRRAFAHLTTEQQHVLALRFGLGHSLEDTAELMNKNANAIKALQFRALAALERHIRGQI